MTPSLPPKVRCEALLLCLLDVLEPAVPPIGPTPLSLDLVLRLLSRDQALFWPRMLRLANEKIPVALSHNRVSRLKKHPLLDRISTTAAALAQQLRERSIQVNHALPFLLESQKDRHETLWLYLREASSIFAEEANARGVVDKVLDQAVKLQSS